MSSVKLISQGYTQLRRGNEQLYKYSYDLGSFFTMEKIKKFVLAKVEKIKNYRQRKYFLNVKFNGVYSNSGWMLSNRMNYDQIKNIEEGFMYLVDSSVDVMHKKARYIIILVEGVIKKGQGMGEDDDNNDCLYDAIYQAHNFDRELLPAGIRTRGTFKKFLGLNRKDKVPFELLPKLEEKLKCSFTITGDEEYHSQVIQKYNITLKCKNEHVTLKSNNCTIKKRAIINPNPYKKDNIFTIFFDEEGGIYCHDGKSTELISEEKYAELKNDYNNFMLLKCDTKESMEQERTDYFHKADKLLEASEGLINMYKSQHVGKIAFDLFQKKSKMATEPKPLHTTEHKILNGAFRGGLHFAQKGTYENCIDYDMNSMYPHYMTQLACLIPTEEPEFKMMTQSEFDGLAFLSFGLYKVSFSNTHRLWTITNNSPWYTHYDIKIAQQLGMKVALFENQTNVLLYHPADCLRGNKIFKTFVEFCDNIGHKDEELRAMVKPIRNSLWGFMGRKNVDMKRLKKTDSFDINDHYIESMVMGDNVCVVKTVEKTNVFKYSYCRFSVFFTGYCRFQIMNFILKSKNLADIVAINTDGFVSKTEQEHLVISDKIGDFKIKQKGNCTVTNSCDVKFF